MLIAFAVLPVNKFYQSFSSQTKGFLPNVIASRRRRDPEKSLKFIIFNILSLTFCWIASPTDRNDVWLKPLFNQQKLRHKLFTGNTGIEFRMTG